MIYKEQKPEVIFTKKHWKINQMKIKSSITGKSKFSVYAERPDTVMIVPFINESEILLIREYCPAYNKNMFFLPKGKIEQDEDPESAANRELQEEINFKAKQIKKIGKLEDDKIKTDTYVFIAKDLQESAFEGDELEESETVRCAFPELSEMLKLGKITESRTIASLFMAKVL